jgi:hypothetical protein
VAHPLTLALPSDFQRIPQHAATHWSVGISHASLGVLWFSWMDIQTLWLSKCSKLQGHRHESSGSSVSVVIVSTGTRNMASLLRTH